MLQCLSPSVGWICGSRPCKSDGVVSPHVVFSYSQALRYHLGSLDALQVNEIHFPCGKCMPCLIRKRKDLALRISHECSLYDHNAFVTLTYNPSNLPLDSLGVPCLDKSHVQKFLKRLRAFLARKMQFVGLRYFCVGEYGTKSLRPHYHLVLFGWTPPDLKFLCVRGSNTLSRSQILESLWPYGFVSVGDSNSSVARYCSGYVTKKITSLHKPVSVPEFCLMSKMRGGIGAPWVDCFPENLNKGLLNVKDSAGSYSPPRYYLDRLRKTHLDYWLALREQRKNFKKPPLQGYEYYDTLRGVQFDRYKSARADALQTL